MSFYSHGPQPFHYNKDPDDLLASYNFFFLQMLHVGKGNSRGGKRMCRKLVDKSKLESLIEVRVKQGVQSECSSKDIESESGTNGIKVRVTGSQNSKQQLGKVR